MEITLSASSTKTQRIGKVPISFIDHTTNNHLLSKSAIQQYCKDQLDVIRRINGIESLKTPVSFMCIAAFIGFLSRLAYGNNKAHDNDSQMYIKFVTNIMGVIKCDYKTIAGDLYYVFRCGIVHSMSFKPPVDASMPKHNIAISHDTQTKWQTGKGFYSVSKQGVTYTVLNADDLIRDLYKSVDHIFADPNLSRHAISFANTQPPIQGL